MSNIADLFPLPEQNVRALLSGSRWSSPQVTYSFPDQRTDYDYFELYLWGFQPIGTYHQNAVQNVLEGNGSTIFPTYMNLSAVEHFTNLDFVFTGYNTSDISVAQSVLRTRSIGYYPVSGTSQDGDVFLAGDINDPTVGTFGYYTVLHELGHALGLKHGHEGDELGNSTVLTEDRDSIEFSVMTYREHVGDEPGGFDADAPSTFMMYDIAALQYLYGANFNVNSTDTTYTFDPQTGQILLNYEDGVAQSSKLFMTIWDGGGVDTYDLGRYRTNLSVDLTPGGWSVFSEDQLADLSDGIKARGNVFNALQYKGDPRSLIENVLGGLGNDDIRGNAADNALRGSAGNDTLYGAAGDDFLVGGVGADHLRGGSGEDTLDGGAGTYDTVEYSDSTISVYVNLGTNVAWGGTAQGDVIAGFENIIGSAADDVLYGSSGANVILGNRGSDQIVGSGGNDYLAGEDGDDMLIVNEGGSATMVGASGDDRFVVFPGTQAKIMDFVAGAGHIDEILIYKNIFASFAEVRGVAYESGNSTFITKGDFRIELVGVRASQLHVDDFNFLNI